MIELIVVSEANELDDDLKQIYLDSFPDNERREWNEMQPLLLNPLFNIFKITHRSILKGIITLWKWPDLLFIEHFALKEEARSQGTGTRVLKQIMEQNASTIILEVEPPFSEQAKRRIAFYQRLGFILCPQEYYQPPYAPGNERIKMCIMSHPQVLNNGEFTSIKKQLYKEVYKWDN